MKEQIKRMIDDFVEDGCWYRDGTTITEDCAKLDCHYCFTRHILQITRREVGKELSRFIEKERDPELWGLMQALNRGEV